MIVGEEACASMIIFAPVDSLTNLSLTAPIFAEKAAKISEISTNALFSVVKLIP